MTFRSLSVALALLLTSAAVTPPASATTTTAQTVSSTDVHNPDEVEALWRDIVAPSPAIGFTGNVGTCEAGTTSPAFRAAELRSLNAMRALVGVNPAVEDPAWSAQAQKAALIMAANNRLDHFPDSTFDCFTEAGAEGAGSSNLYLYNNGVYAMWGYVADPGAANSSAGHRRWLLDPMTTRVGFGDTPTSNATKVFGSDFTSGSQESRDGFVAWPNPGLVPVNIAGPRGLLHLFSIQLDHTYFVGNAQVSVTSSTRGQVPVTEIVRSGEGAYNPAVVFQPVRLPDAGESWTVRVSGLIRDSQPAAPIISTSSFVVLSPDAAFVKAVYTDFLGRLPTPLELDDEVTLIDDGIPRSSLIQRLSRSTEWVSNLVKGFYLDTLGRAPDPSGLAYWADQIASGRASVAKVASLFYSSSEYFTTVGNGDLASWINDLYRKILSRPADTAGRAYWVSIAAAKGRGAVTYSMFQSQESRQTRVTKLFVTLLARQPDEAGLSYWSDKLRTQGDLTLAVNLAASIEYATRAKARF